jgi:DNA-binding NarL/FixJ family response regulator
VAASRQCSTSRMSFRKLLRVSERSTGDPGDTPAPDARDFRLVAGNPVCVLVAHGDASIGDRIGEALQKRAGLSFVGCASTGDEALDLVMSASPNVAFVSHDMPGAAAATLRILSMSQTPPRVVLMSSEVSSPSRSNGLESDGEIPGLPGVSGYLARSDDALDVVDVVAALSPLVARAGATRHIPPELSYPIRGGWSVRAR